MNNREAIQRLAKVQGNLLKLVAQLESCKLILQGAYAPSLEDTVSLDRGIDEWLNSYRKK